MKKIVVLLLLVIITIGSFAQEKYQDVVYLKNGSIIRGMIIEQVPNKSLKIQTADRSVFVYSLEEIEKYTKELVEPESSPNKSSFKNDNSGLKAGYRGTVEVGYQLGVGDFGLDRLKMNIINAYQLSPYFSLGIGTGLRFYYDADAALIPVFADFRAYVLNHKVSPYLSLGAGYSFNATNNLDGVGIFLNPAAGVSFKVSKKSSMNIGLGYEMQRMDFFFYGYYNNYPYTYSSLENSGAISLTAGFSF